MTGVNKRAHVFLVLNRAMLEISVISENADISRVSGYLCYAVSLPT